MKIDLNFVLLEIPGFFFCDTSPDFKKTQYLKLHWNIFRFVQFKLAQMGIPKLIQAHKCANTHWIWINTIKILKFCAKNNCNTTYFFKSHHYVHILKLLYLLRQGKRKWYRIQTKKRLPRSSIWHTKNSFSCVGILYPFITRK